MLHQAIFPARLQLIFSTNLGERKTISICAGIEPNPFTQLECSTQNAMASWATCYIVHKGNFDYWTKAPSLAAELWFQDLDAGTCIIKLQGSLNYSRNQYVSLFLVKYLL